MTTKTKRGSFIEWIDVNERKPTKESSHEHEIDPFVLACCGLTPSRQIVRELRYSLRNDHFYSDYPSFQIWKITHWAELPKPFAQSQLAAQNGAVEFH